MNLIVFNLILLEIKNSYFFLNHNYNKLSDLIGYQLPWF